MATPAIAALVVAVVAILLVPQASVGPSPSPSPSAVVAPTGSPSGSPTGSSSVTPSASPSVSPSVAWTRLTWSPGVALGDGRFVSDLVPWGTGFVGVGGIETASGLDVAFFTSTDGFHWNLATRQTTAEANVHAASVVALGSMLFAVGQAVMNAPGVLPDFPPPLWVSKDGTSWAPVHSSSWEAAFSSKWPARLVAGPGGVVAVSLGSDPVLVASTDGVTWTRATLPVAERAIVEDAASSTIGYVIVGRDGQPDQRSDVEENSPQPFGVGQPAAWISSDGMTWSEASVGGDKVVAAQLSQVVAVRDGLIAAGIKSTADYDAQRATSWFSPDGRTWSIAAALAMPAGASPYPVLAGDGSQAIVFGREPGDATLTAWRTSGAEPWTPLSFIGTPPPTNCGKVAACMTYLQAWVVPGGVIVMGTPGAMTPGTFWFAKGS
jgi:hypothetical protein